LIYGLTFAEAVAAIENNNSVVDGNFIDHASEQYIIRRVRRTATMNDLENIAVKTGKRNFSNRKVKSTPFAITFCQEAGSTNYSVFQLCGQDFIPSEARNLSLERFLVATLLGMTYSSI
jgi:hypothetical protein